MSHHMQDDWDRHWDDYSESTKRVPSLRFRRAIILNILKKEKADKFNIVDFGSGPGDLLNYISKNFNTKNMLGLELSAKGVAISSKKLPQALFIQKNLLESRNLQKELKHLACFADYGLCVEVIEHLDHPEKFLQNIKYYLKPDAKLILTVPGGLMSEFERHLGHRKHYTKAELSKLLYSAGYTNFSIKAVGFPFFNLFKIMTIMRGKKLINDAKKKKSSGFSYYLSSIIMKIFNILFKFNLNFIPLGWQLVAVIKVSDRSGYCTDFDK